MDLIELLTRRGLPLIFLAVLLEQGGLPLPAAPLLVVAGALAGNDLMRPEFVLGAAVVAALFADHLWFWIGKRFGRRVLGTLCLLSLSPDTCVRQTDALIMRHGAPLLLVAKFIPGVSAVSIPSAAATGLSYRRFLLFDGIGICFWAGAYIGAGMIFSREVNRILDTMSVIGGWGFVILGALAGAYLGLKLWHRFRLTRLHRLVRITPEEVGALLLDDPHLVIVDTRTPLARSDDPRMLPRSVMLDDRSVVELLPLDARGRTIVTFCTCPNEASAALLAEQLIKAGFARVRVLTGGRDALETLAVRGQ